MRTLIKFRFRAAGTIARLSPSFVIFSVRELQCPRSIQQRGLRGVILHNPISMSSFRTAGVGVALSSWKSSLTEGARGFFYPHSFPTLFHTVLLCGNQALYLVRTLSLSTAVRRNLVYLVGQVCSVLEGAGGICCVGRVGGTWSPPFGGRCPSLVAESPRATDPRG